MAVMGATVDAWTNPPQYHALWRRAVFLEAKFVRQYGHLEADFQRTAQCTDGQILGAGK